MLLSRHLVDSLHIGAVVTHAVSQIYPSLAQHAASIFEDGKRKKPPHKSTVSRTRVVLDAALLLAEHDEVGHARPCMVRYGMADSSPQKGNDWLLSCYDEVPVDRTCSYSMQIFSS